MKWVEVLALFNFITWLLPIAIRSWIAWRSPNVSRNTLNSEELGSLSRSVARLNLGGKVLKIGDRAEKPRSTEE